MTDVASLRHGHAFAQAKTLAENANLPRNEVESKIKGAAAGIIQNGLRLSLARMKMLEDQAVEPALSNWLTHENCPGFITGLTPENLLEHLFSNEQINSRTLSILTRESLLYLDSFKPLSLALLNTLSTSEA
ncbi:type III-B CRISPR module-associated protein Cmr5 [Woodsholea maritima]|uniref:type III-B CRISPR module-associated protein Cmr5 n=1 Tax=Woodsholea maritima TaxID=240237 RepID=UPI00036689EE|nr:type III-B CRISPR module-associated protein Cmr5 [Woodsholea maritima]